MKRHWTLLFLGISTLLLGGCEKEWYDEYLVVNSTDYDIVIYAFDKDISKTKIDQTIKLPAQGSYSVLRGNGFASEVPGIFDNSDVDSVVIVFDSIRSIIQSCDWPIGLVCEIEHNIMDYDDRSNFVKTKRGKSSGQAEYTYAYTFTQEDYDNATLIE